MICEEASARNNQVLRDIPRQLYHGRRCSHSVRLADTQLAASNTPCDGAMGQHWGTFIDRTMPSNMQPPLMHAVLRVGRLRHTNKAALG